MPRPLRRSLLPGYPLHVLQRGHNRSACFKSDTERVLYLGLMQEFSERNSCAVHAYVMMTNHVHALISPPDIASLSRMMQKVNQIFAQYVNRRQGRSGPLWETRFKTCLVDTRHYFLNCQRYIELNPVRAGMVDQPGGYPWSSYCTSANGMASLLIAPHDAYQRLGATPDARRAAYRALFEQPISEELLAKIRASINRGIPLGDEDFVRELECQSSAKPGPGPGLAPVGGFTQPP